MKDGVNLKSKSGIHRMLSALEERGYIKKLNNRARAIEVIKNVVPSINEFSVKDVDAVIIEKPFYDPKKKIASA